MRLDLAPPNVTVEISPRRSGKTFRLVDNVIRHRQGAMRDSKDSIIISFNNHVGRYIRDMINDRIDRGEYPRRWRQNMRVYSYNGIDNKSLHNLNREGHRIYFDEFEMIQDLPIFDNTYYSSSPRRRLRESNTARLTSVFGTGNNLTEEWVNNYTDNLITAEDFQRAVRLPWEIEDFSDLEDTEMTEEEAYRFRLGI